MDFQKWQSDILTLYKDKLVIFYLVNNLVPYNQRWNFENVKFNPKFQFVIHETKGP